MGIIEVLIQHKNICTCKGNISVLIKTIQTLEGTQASNELHISYHHGWN
jgi:hypothetical protein